MLPSIYGENMFDDFFGNGFFGGHDARCSASTQETS